MMVHCFEQWELIPDQGPLEQRSASLPHKEAADQEHEEGQCGTLSTLYVIGLGGDFKVRKGCGSHAPSSFPPVDCINCKAGESWGNYDNAQPEL